MILAITGHRDISAPIALQHQLRKVYFSLMPTRILQGMAIGADQIAARAALDLGIPYVAVRPWAGHTAGEDYTYILSKAADVVVLDTGSSYKGPWQHHNRNRYLVDSSDHLLAIWVGRKSGGTYACIQYANKKMRPVTVLDPVSMSLKDLQCNV